jgi:general secretion pathway protein J
MKSAPGELHVNSLTKDNRAFTLVEILIAILIFSVVMATLFSSFKAFILSSENIKEEVEYSEKIRNIFKRIKIDLESIFILQPPRYKKPQFNSDPDPYSFVGNEVTLGQQIVSTLVFPSFAHAQFGADLRTGVARIAYYLKENKNNGYDLYRADALPPFPEDLESCFDPVLIKDISGFKVVFKDVNGDEYTYWNSDDEAVKYTFPASIDFTIIFGTGEQIRVFETSIGLVPGREPIE